MRTDRIHEIDLACICPLPTEMKWEALRRLKVFVPPHTFKPVRRTLFDIFSVQPNRHISLARTPWPCIDAKIRNLSANTSEESANVCAAEGLHAYASAHSIHGVANQFTRMSLGRGGLSYWSNMVLDIGGVTVVPFLDPRVSGGLTEIGMQFVFSVMDLRVRQLDVDFYDAYMAILRLSPPIDGRRHVQPYFDTGTELFSQAQLKAMVRETYDIWRLVLQERADERREKPRKATSQIELPFDVRGPARKAS
ncbi:MAG: hypothetical protein HYU59_07515 [Magnetospirillum gryphiswaldense]|nr:hypothetical protein [Magnetospirillum gryphiswaldense]